MWSQPGTAAISYADLIFHRVRNGMLINDWTVDWSREPYTHSFYPQALLCEMKTPTLHSSLFSGAKDISPRVIADALYGAYGYSGMRLNINRNDRMQVYCNAAAAKWGRTTASGGGRYCADFYLIESGQGDNGNLEPGIYHYTPLRHGWERLKTGDYTQNIAQAQDYPDTAERYLLITINYWRSGFKYNDFAYQATAMDVGTVMASLMTLLGDQTDHTWDMWINEQSIAPLLGLDTDTDGVYAIQGWGNKVERGDVSPSSITELPYRVSMGDGTVRNFITTLDLQRDMVGYPSRPEHWGIRQVVDRSAKSDTTFEHWNSLMRRTTSFGRFLPVPYDESQLISILDKADELSVALLPLGESNVRLEYLIYVSRVNGLRPGLYTYTGRTGQLTCIQEGAQDKFLEGTYFLSNYDSRKAAATIIICGNVYQCCQRWGVRGYRLLNAVVGASCQAISIEGARLKIGTGAALGFDAEAHANHAGMDKRRMTPMLMMMTGVDDPRAGSFHSEVSPVHGNEGAEYVD